MIRHIFKLIWNRKRSNFLMMLEITLSFIVLFAVGSMILYGFNSYNKPTGFTYENVRVLRMDWNIASMRFTRDMGIRETVLWWESID